MLDTLPKIRPLEHSSIEGIASELASVNVLDLQIRPPDNPQPGDIFEVRSRRYLFTSERRWIDIITGELVVFLGD